MAKHPTQTDGRWRVRWRPTVLIVVFSFGVGASAGWEYAKLRVREAFMAAVADDPGVRRILEVRKTPR